MCVVQVGMPRRGKDGQMERDARGQPVIAMMPKLQTACTTEVSEGMVVLTQTPEVVKARQGVLEFLLINHPLDCPVCDKGGECDLQDLTYRYGPGKSRFPLADKHHFVKPVDLSPLIVLDRERCIVCQRCTRFCSEIAGDNALVLVERGAETYLDVFPGRTYDCKFSGNTVDICPVGALTSRAFRFRARAWEGERYNGICPRCSCGCNISVQVRSGQVVRLVARENEAVNEAWICDKGRFTYDYINSAERLGSPLVRKGGVLTPVSWDEALKTIATGLRAVQAANGPDSVGGVVSSRSSNEELYLFQKLFRAGLGTNNVDHRLKERWYEDQGLLDLPLSGPIQGLEKADAILVLGGDVVQEQPIVFLWLRKAVVRGGARLVSANPKATELNRLAHLWLGYRYGGETALIYGLINALVAEGLCAEEHLRERFPGWDSLLKKIGEHTPERVSRATGLKPEALGAAARALAGAANPLILFGNQIIQQANADAVIRALANLALARLERGPASLMALGTNGNSQGAVDLGVLPTALPGRRSLGDGEYRARLAAHWGVSLSDRPGLSTRKMLSWAGSKVKGLYLLGVDLLSDYPDGAKAERALEALDFLVVQDLLLTPIAVRAQVVLPGTSFVEKEGTYTNLEGRVQRNAQGFRPREGIMAEWQALSALGRELGGDFGYASPGEIREEMARALPWYRDLEAMGHASALSSRPGESQRRFFRGERLGMPVEDEGFPFILLLGEPFYSTDTFSSRCPALGPVLAKSRIEMNPRGASALGLMEGEAVRVSSSAGELGLPVRHNPDCPPGTVYIPWRGSDVNANRLFCDGMEVPRVKISRIP
jgi:NADH-quinone oxidoreductase chain G